MASGHTYPMQHESGYIDLATVMSTDYGRSERRSKSLGGEGDLCLIVPNADSEVRVKTKGKKKKAYRRSSTPTYRENTVSPSDTTPIVQTEIIHIPGRGSVSSSVQVEEGITLHGGDVRDRAQLKEYSEDCRDRSNRKNLHVRIDPSILDSTKHHTENMGTKTKKDKKPGEQKTHPSVNVKDETVERSVKNGNIPSKTNDKLEQPEQPSAEEDEKFLEWVKAQFIKVAGEDNSIDLDEFKHALGIKNVSSTTYRR